VDLIIKDLSRQMLRLASIMNGVSLKDPVSAATRLAGVRASEIAAASLPAAARITTIRSDNPQKWPAVPEHVFGGRHVVTAI
jgi:hypothetical protein